MQSEEETLEHTTNATNEERTIGQEENIETTKDDDTLGSKPKRQKKSTVWQDFTEMKDADGVMKISCIHCKKMYTKSKTAATTQLHRHLQSCGNYLRAKADKSKDGLLQTQLGFISSSVDPSACPSLFVGKFDMEKMKESVAHWIMMHEHPFSIVEEEGFNLMQRRGMSEWRGLTRNTTKAYCINVYESEKKKLKSLLNNVNKINLTTDCWKSKNQKIEYMVITGHWIDESWQLQKRVLNFVHIPPPRRGLEIANAIWLYLEGWGIESKIHTISVDNASANDSAIDNLKVYKLRALEFCFPRLYSSENVERQIAIVRKTLYELYSEYVAISNIEDESIGEGQRNKLSNPDVTNVETQCGWSEYAEYLKFETIPTRTTLLCGLW
ncbi:hypothetical protein Salat_0938700 [Sesamum alatum]|uniref:BED-type domain-containing protein n=1 Tax=Sesamum alatum TaxID=300844 RepID=A0AAE2CRE2_9LAMI|nr:hypothetical protein Salat_0938700 [Sesamum alatum]